MADEPGDAVPVCVRAPMVKLGAAVPVPLSTTVWGEPAALSETVRFAVKLAVDVGVKERVMVQFDPAASEVPQVLVWLKFPALVPVMEIPAMLSAALPELARVTVCVALVAPLAAVKLSGPGGVSDATGAVTAWVTETIADPDAEVKIEELFASGV